MIVGEMIGLTQIVYRHTVAAGDQAQGIAAPDPVLGADGGMPQQRLVVAVLLQHLLQTPCGRRWQQHVLRRARVSDGPTITWIQAQNFLAVPFGKLGEIQ